MYARYQNSFGEWCHAPVVARFKEVGVLFVVIGPVPRGTYDHSAPYDVWKKKDVTIVRDCPDD